MRQAQRQAQRHSHPLTRGDQGTVLIPRFLRHLHSASERVEEAETFAEAVYAAIEYAFWLEITLTLPYTAYLLLTGQIPEDGKTCGNMVL